MFFLGEAPGKVEDKLGKPFVGPAGDVLNDTLTKLQLTSFLIANTVCCIPWEIVGDKIRAPFDSEIDACADHVYELLELTRPKLIVSLGEVAKSHLARLIAHHEDGSSLQEKTVHLRHPAFILRRGGKESNEHKLFTYTLQKALAAFDIDHAAYYSPTSYAESVR